MKKVPHSKAVVATLSVGAFFLACICSPTISNAEVPSPLEQKLQAIHIPTVGYREATLEDVVSHLSELSKKHDPTKVGVVFSVRVDGVENIEHRQGTLITLEKWNVSLYDAVRAIAVQGKLGVRLEKDRVILVSFNPADNPVNHPKRVASFEQLLDATYGRNSYTHPGTAVYLIGKLLADKPINWREWEIDSPTGTKSFQPTEVEEREALSRLRAMALSSGSLQTTAVQALGIAKDADSADDLLGLLDQIESAPELHKMAIWSLGQIRSTVAVEPISQFLAHTNPAVADEAYQALQQIGSIEALQACLVQYEICPTNNRALGAAVRIFSEMKSQLPDVMADIPAAGLTSLAEALTKTLERAQQSYFKGPVSERHIKKIMNVGAWYFIATDFGHSGQDFLARKQADDGWVDAVPVGGWIE